MLHALQRPGKLDQLLRMFGQIFRGNARHAEERIQLIHRAVAFDAKVIFKNPLPACQARVTAIARSRINSVQRNPRFVENTLIHNLVSVSCRLVPPLATIATTNASEQPFYNLDSVSMPVPIRVLVAKPGLDGHDRGAKVIARALRDAGMEVIYTGLRQTPEMIVNAALQEDVQVIGLSILSGAHNAIVPRLMELLRQNEMTDVLVVVGGIIPDDDAAELKREGVAAVFQPGASLEKIIGFIRDSVKQPASA